MVLDRKVSDYDSLTLFFGVSNCDFARSYTKLPTFGGEQTLRGWDKSSLRPDCVLGEQGFPH